MSIVVAGAGAKQLRPLFLPYSAECVEGLFSEGPLNGVLRSLVHTKDLIHFSS